MKKDNLSKLGKAILSIELSRDPFGRSEEVPTIIALNERFNLSEIFNRESEEKIIVSSVLIEDAGKYEIKKFYCWSMLMGFRTISFKKDETFVDAIAEIKDDTIAHLGIMPSHLICETTVSVSASLPTFGTRMGDIVKYEIYYLHPDQRERIDATVFLNANPPEVETREEFIFKHGYFPEN